MAAPHTVVRTDELKGKTPLLRSKLYLGDALLCATVAQQDNGEPLVTASQLQRMGFVIRPFWVDEPGEIEGKAYQAYIKTHPDFSMSLRQGLAHRLAKTQSALPAEWRIILKAGLRPLSVQRLLFNDARAYLHQKHPDWQPRKLLQETRNLVSDPRVKVPPHCTGAAVDIEILDKTTGELVDMGARANTDGPSGWAYSPTITPVQQERRLLLLKATLYAGLANNAYEWWHYSYGDAMWALMYDQPATLYSLIAE